MLTRSALNPSGVCVALFFTASMAAAESMVMWTIDETLNRSDQELFWTSPTAIEIGLPGYEYGYEITKIEATVRPLFNDITVDVTSQIGAVFDLIGNGEAPTLPVVLTDEALDDPTTGTSANVLIEVDTNGFGQAAFTDVALGSVEVPLLGVTDIRSIRIQANVTVSVATPPEPADFNGDGAVDTNDYALWTQLYGIPGMIGTDANGDGATDAADYTIWRDRFESPLDATATPEPTAALLVAMGVLGSLGRCRRS